MCGPKAASGGLAIYYPDYHLTNSSLLLTLAFSRLCDMRDMQIIESLDTRVLTRLQYPTLILRTIIHSNSCGPELSNVCPTTSFLRFARQVVRIVGRNQRVCTQKAQFDKQSQRAKPDTRARQFSARPRDEAYSNNWGWALTNWRLVPFCEGIMIKLSKKGMSQNLPASWCIFFTCSFKILALMLALAIITTERSLSS